MQRPVEHGPAPDHRRVARGLEHADRDDLDVMRHRRHDHVLDLGGPLGGAQHARNAVAVDVGVDDADLEAARGHGGGEVDRDGGLAHPALAAGHREDAGQRAGLVERDLLLRAAVAAQLGLQDLALLGAHDVELDLDARHAFDLADGGGDVAGDGVLHRTAGHGEVDADAHRPVGSDLDALDHVEVRDRAADLGVDDGGERRRHQFLGRCHRSLGTRECRPSLVDICVAGAGRPARMPLHGMNRSPRRVNPGCQMSVRSRCALKLSVLKLSALKSVCADVVIRLLGVASTA